MHNIKPHFIWVSRTAHRGSILVHEILFSQVPKLIVPAFGPAELFPGRKSSDERQGAGVWK
jgi:hypothetical protein